MIALAVIGGLAAIVLATIVIAARRAPILDDDKQDRLRAAFHAEAERLVPDDMPDWDNPRWRRWPDTCGCSGWDAEADQMAVADATREEPAGRHHRRQSHGEHVVLASVTDLRDRKEQR